jgi:hypothetical protein
VVFRVIHTIQFCLLASVYFVCLPTGSDFAFSANYRDTRSVAILVDVHTKCSRFLHGKCEVGSIDFIQIAFPQFAHAEVHCSLCDARLKNVFVQVQERKRGHATHMQGRLACLQLRA